MKMELENAHHSTAWDHAETMAIRNVMVDQAYQAELHVRAQASGSKVRDRQFLRAARLVGCTAVPWHLDP
jgi:hypothetical protein